MTSRAAAILRALVAFLVPLALWRTAYPLSDWAALALAPLAIAIWTGVYAPLRDRRRAELSAAILPGAALGRWLTGRMGARVNATIATFVTVPVLAWAALGASAPVLAVLVGVCLIAGWVSVAAERRLTGALTGSYARLASHRIASGLGATAGLIPLVWLNWAVIPVPHEMTEMGLAEAISAALDHLPGREGWLREGLGVFAALDAAKLWLAANHREALWVGLIFSLDSALVSVVTARSFVAVQEFTRRATGASE